MNLFWVAAGLISAAAAIIVLLRASRAAALVEPADATSLLYRRQMAELADLADRGLLGEAERASAEAEAGRRLLGAVETPDQAWTPGMTGKAPLAIGAGAAAVLAFVLYLVLGAPGAVDQPFAGRLAHWRSVNPQTLAAPEMAAVLSQMTREHPDPEGFRYLALAEIASGNPPGAVRALRRAVKIAPQRADLWEMLGEALTQQDGDASDDARRAFAEALALDPASQGARFYLGRSEITDGDRPKGLAMWRQLLSELPADDPRRAQLQAAILEAEAAPAAGPAGPAGPAAGLTADQLTAVRGMVAGLAAKLKADPGDAAGWVRLVRAYAVLGDTAARDAALKEARARNASRPDVLDDLKNAAAVEPMK